MTIHEGSNEHAPVAYSLDRPCKCTMVLCCFMINPQQIHTHNLKTGQPIHVGKVEQDWRCLPALCGKRYWKAYDSAGAVQYVLKDDLCANGCNNAFAPSCCCKVHHTSIMDAAEVQEVGSVQNIFPGCSCRSLLCSALIDNYKLNLPSDANADARANLLAGLFLVDFMKFNNNDNKNDN